MEAGPAQLAIKRPKQASRSDRRAAAFAEGIDPAPENGAGATSWALAHHVTSVSLKRVRSRPAGITAEQLGSLRRRIGLPFGLEPIGG
jgi:hypothetical protein